TWSAGGQGDTRGDALNDIQLIIVRIMRDVCTVSFDSSGAALHARGYREASGKAPMRESLAAAMLLAGEWSHASPLVDPMCGSGTIPIEAALMARRIAPGLEREFAFQQWAQYDAAAWEEIRDEAASTVLSSAGVTIIASDRDAGAVAATLSNAERAGVAEDIDVRRCSISEMETPPSDSGWLVT